MRIHLDQIGTEGYDLDEKMTAGFVAQTLGKTSTFRAHGDGKLVAHLDRLDHGVIHVLGKVDLTVAAACSRCLEPVVLPLDAPIDVTLFPRGHEPAPRPSGEVADEDMGVATYEGNEIDLGHIVHDEVFLGLPMIPVCRDDCRGLCPTCGENLNRQQCDCRPIQDHRFEALLHFKPS